MGASASSPPGVGSETTQDEQYRACKRLACDIQRCLATSDHDEQRCADAIARYNACVRDHYGAEPVRGARSAKQ